MSDETELTFDVFLSYKKGDDSDRARVIRHRLEELDLKVWQDVEIGHDGEPEWGKTIRSRLKASKVVLVLWSEHSIQSRWVDAEATFGFDQKRLVCICLGTFKPGMLEPPYNTLQSHQLEAWLECGAARDDANWCSVLAMLGKQVGRPGLADLSRTRAAGSLEAKKDFVRKRPDDPAASAFADELEAAERERFTTEAARLRQQVDAHVRQIRNSLDRLGAQQAKRLAVVRAGGDSPSDGLVKIAGLIAKLGSTARAGEIVSGELQEQLRKVETELVGSRAEVAALTQSVERLQPFEAAAMGAEEDSVKLRDEVKRLKTENESRDGELRDAKAQVSGLKSDIGGLRVALAEAEQRRPGSPVAKPSRASLILRYGAVAVLAAVLGAGVLAATSQTLLAPGRSSTTAGIADLQARESLLQAEARRLKGEQEELERSRAALTQDRRDGDRRAAKLASDENQLADRRRALDQQMDQLRKDRADFERERAAFATSRSQPAPPPSTPTPSSPTAAASSSAAAVRTCDELAANSFDPDAAGLVTAPHDSNYDVPERALSDCRLARDQAGSAPARRRLGVNLGRAYASGAKRATNAGQRAAADDLFRSAVAEWEKARTLSSGQASFYLGAYHRKSFNPDVTTDYPASLDFAKAKSYFSEASRLNHMLGRVNLAMYLIMPDEYQQDPPTPEQVREGRRLLDSRDTFGVPLRSYVVGRAKLLGDRSYRRDDRAGFSNIIFAACRGEGAALRFLRGKDQRIRGLGLDPAIDTTNCSKFAAAD